MPELSVNGYLLMITEPTLKFDIQISKSFWVAFNCSSPGCIFLEYTIIGLKTSQLQPQKRLSKKTLCFRINAIIVYSV